MNGEYQFFAALLVGLMGAGHCFGMCGGIVGAFSQALPAHRPLGQRMGFLFAYNSGRIFSYIVAGAAVGGLAGALGTLFQLDHYLAVLQLLAGVMLVLMGLYIAQWLPLLAHVERAGKPIWQAMAPLRQRFLPIDTTGKALGAGMLWGWLPCGLVYSTLTWALASANPVEGGIIMAGFGLGTLPALVAMGAAADKIAQIIRKKQVKWLSAVVLIAYGGQMSYIALNQIM
ncbi:sulfite exporter TauE/SafE family protein [Ferrimonas balearica]|uniref:sulfite exporter TauE/SafE family protein n=1 Tax=Ferrimonas balearica TaxID=44012 RepID=UPI001C99130F|nr:sulfite exporter TauE/SafE family protein [Ferrimonas balearica]MBY5920394.1 sulfite exporter TauE/SafE family protein [Ferrimonas balearica]MBY5996921.1 sulfite exporter TauE/SafE family protein [Ferrimonas balearica]